MVTANDVGTRKLSYERPCVRVNRSLSVSSTAFPAPPQIAQRLPAPPYAPRLPAPPYAPRASRAHPAPPVVVPVSRFLSAPPDVAPVSRAFPAPPFAPAR